MSDVPENKPMTPAALVPPTGESRGECKSQTAGEAVRFLIEQYQTAYDHQLARSNILLTINTAAIAGALAWLPSASPGYAWFGIVVALAGILFCVLWVQLNLISQFLLARYEADARRIASENPEVRADFFISLMFREQIEAGNTGLPEGRETSALLDRERQFARWIAKKLGRDENMQGDAADSYRAEWKPSPAPRWFGYDFLDLRRPRVPSQTELMHLVVVLFAAIWLAVAIAAIVRCFG